MKHSLNLILLMIFLSLTTYSQRETTIISGYVFDAETKLGLPDVNIYTDGKTIGGTSDSNGYFKISINKLPSLIYFSHIGYKIQQFLVESSNIHNLRIYMEPDIKELDEVIISDEKIVRLFKKKDLY